MNLYYEKPGYIYLIADIDETGVNDLEEKLLSQSGEHIHQYAEMGIHFEHQMCIILCPEDLKSAEDIINTGHKFNKIDNHGQTTFYAHEVIASRNFAIETHIEEILEKAIKRGHVEMYYQPIYDVKSNTFHSAEALVRIVDPDYGVISPSIFIPAAEAQGLIIPIGDAILENVFRFISENDLDDLGLSYIEINLSVAQCVEKSLPNKIYDLQQKYGVDPKRVNLEITETTFENISEVTMDNVKKLIEMGYSFALDDYGTGYSNIQRVNSIPFKLIKIDKSMLDEVGTNNGRMILEHTIKMMQSIGKKLVCEGAETLESVKILKWLNCDYIQGFYFSKPIPADEFIHFLEKNKK